MWDLIVSVPDHCLSFYSKLEIPFSDCSVLLAVLSFHFNPCNEARGNVDITLNPRSPAQREVCTWL